MASEDCYKLQIGQVLRYRRAEEEPEKYVDDLLNFRWIAQFPNAGAFQLERGINTPSLIKGVDGIKRRPAILIASSPHKKGTSETPWQDFFDPDNGHIRYYGDNKNPGKDPASALGNKALLHAFQLAHSHEKELRAQTPPMLFFRRVTHDGKSKGFPQFLGFGVIRSAELVTQWDNKAERSFTNYAFDFTVLNMQAEHEVFDWNWIQSRRDTSLTLEESNRRGPESWRKWIASGANSLDTLRRRVSKLSIESQEDQRPAEGTELFDVLQTIYSYYAGRKHKFEALAEIISERVVGNDLGIYRKGWVTAAGGDGGADFIASIELGSGFSSAKLIVLGQAKCESLTTATGGNHIARTVARLKRGWLGVYVTTSYFSAPVQQEVIEDRYPIVLIHGKRVAKEVSEIVHESDTYDTVEEFLDEVTSAYESRIRQRQPEEILY